MANYKPIGTKFDRTFRNDLNENFGTIDGVVEAQKTRVDDLISGTEQPSEVVDARGGAPVLRDRLDGVDAQLAQISKQIYRVNVREFEHLVIEGDWSPAVNACIDKLSQVGLSIKGGVIELDVDEFQLASTISWTVENIHFEGAGMDKTFIQDHANLGSNRLFFPKGTSSNPIKNIFFRGITFKNGTATTGTPTTGKDAIRVEYVDGFSMVDCKVTEIEGYYGVVTKYTKNIYVQNNKFYRWSYAGFFMLPECENIRAFDNEFDTAVSTTTAQNYTIGNGGEALNEGEFYVKNVWIERNIFKNNPRWEGIDCHGGENIWIKDNYVENCRIGIMCGIADGYVSNEILKNIVIENNILIQGSGLDDHNGIYINGRDDNTILAENIVIKNNKLKGFGGTVATTIGSITVSIAKKVTIENNTIDEYAQYGICLYYNVKDSWIVNNKILNVRSGSPAPSIVSAICLRSNGIYGVWIDGNEVGGDTASTSPAFFLRSALRSISAQIGKRNTIKHVQTSIYSNNVFLPIEKTAIPTFPSNALTQKFGDEIYTDLGRVGWIVSSPKIGYGSLITDNIVSVTTVSNSNEISISSNLTGDFTWLPEGMNIIIAGAGADGGNLSARIMKNNKTSLVLDVNAATAVSGANLTYQGLTLTAL